MSAFGVKRTSVRHSEMSAYEADIAEDFQSPGDGNLDRLPALAAELVRANVDVILAESSFAVEAARAATKTVPIVMIGVGNAVGSGFVKSISQPGGNITGLTNDSIEVSSKYLEYLRAALP